MTSDRTVLRVQDLHLQRGGTLIQHAISFTVAQGEIFSLVGKSGCGKSTLLRALLGLLPPHGGDVFYFGESFVRASEQRRQQIQRRFGVLYQSAALWSALTLAENIQLPLRFFTAFNRRERREIVRYKLALTGLAGLEDRYPAQLSGGMRKRAALARALALDPEILFCDEPLAGLDPVTAGQMDQLLLELRDSLGTTIILVTHEIQSLVDIADRALFLDADEKRPTAIGSPKELIANPPTAAIGEFFQRWGERP